MVGCGFRREGSLLAFDKLGPGEHGGVENPAGSGIAHRLRQRRLVSSNDNHKGPHNAQGVLKDMVLGAFV